MNWIYCLISLALISCTPAIKKDPGSASKNILFSAPDSSFIEVKDSVKSEKPEKIKRTFSSKKEPEMPQVQLPGVRPYVRVFISSKNDQYIFNTFGRVDLTEIKNDSSRSLGSFRGDFTVSRKGKGLRFTPQIGEAIDAQHTVRIKSFQEFNLMSIDGRPYRGLMEVKSDDDGNISLINEVNIEDYLRGVLPYEMPAENRAVLEALKAQAIAARTYVIINLGKNKARGFDVYASVRDQVYKGTRAETFVSDKAVFATTGIVMIYNDELVRAYYHSTCGGKTANIHEVWGGEKRPYLVSVADADENGRIYCKGSSYFRWFEKWDKKDLTRIIKSNLAEAKVQKPFEFSEVLSLNVLRRTASGRVGVLEVKTDKGNFEVKGDKTRWLLKRGHKGKSILFSSGFEIQKFSDQVLINGWGNGHGIGMCQVGAMERAKSGQSFDTILKAYYTGIKLVQIKYE